MKIHKKIFLTLLFAIFVIGIHNYVSAFNENITYKAEYDSAISYKVTITGLEPEDEEYMYSAMICQEQDVTSSDFMSTGGKAFPIEYDENTNTWEGSTLGAHDGLTKSYGAFEKVGKYYAYVAKIKKGSINYEIIDGPTEIETPDLPPLGERISIHTLNNSTDYYIQVNARDTMLYNGVQRTIRFYVGEVTDAELLKKLSENKEDAYDELLEYAKEQVPNLKENSFQDTKTGTLDYNIVADYPIENGKYYFLYSILDNENGIYNDVEDIEIYNGVKSSEGVSLTDFEYTTLEENESPITNTTDKDLNRNNDNTTATKVLPKAGISTIFIIIVFITLACTIVLYLKNRKYKGIK